MENLKKNIETLAKQEGKSELEIITELQAVVAITGDEDLLEELCELKLDYIPEEYR